MSIDSSFLVIILVTPARVEGEGPDETWASGCRWSHGLQSKQLYASLAAPPAPLRGAT